MYDSFTKMRALPGRPFDILFHHGRYDREAMEVNLNSKKATFVTILRNPVSQFQSAWNFMKYDENLNVTQRDFLLG